MKGGLVCIYAIDVKCVKMMNHNLSPGERQICLHLCHLC